MGEQFTFNQRIQCLCHRIVNSTEMESEVRSSSSDQVKGHPIH